MVRETIAKEYDGDVCAVVKAYQCERCGRTYDTFGEAERCEKGTHEPYIPNGEPFDAGTPIRRFIRDLKQRIEQLESEWMVERERMDVERRPNVRKDRSGGIGNEK